LRLARLLAWTLVIAALAATLRVNIFTISQIPRATTAVPWYDQWIMVDELRHPALWSPYFGHRLVIPRLIFQADARWASLGSLTWLIMTIHVAHMLLLTALAWLLIGRKSRIGFALACVVILNLVLSPFQMENLLWSNQVQFVLVYAAATAAFLFLGAARRNIWFAVPAAVSALTATLTMANGLIVWPILILEAWHLRLSRSTIIALAAAGAAILTAYLWHYHAVAMGMGVGGMIRDPLHALQLLGLLIAGPLDFISIPIGTVVALLALVPMGWLMFDMLRKRSPEQTLATALAALTIFLFLTLVSIVSGRMSPQWFEALHGAFPIPSRIFTPILLFWTAIALVILYTCWIYVRRPIWLAMYGVLFSVLMFGSVSRQLISAEDWADFFGGTEAVGSSLLLDIPDPQLQTLLWPSKPQLDEWVAFLREKRLAMFAEPRATWPGKRATDLFQPAAAHCIGGIETTKQLNGSWRVEGWAWNTDRGAPPTDIILLDTSGMIAGLARGGFRHGYFPGLLMEPGPVPASHASLRHSEFLGYARGDPPWTLHAVIGHQIAACVPLNR